MDKNIKISISREYKDCLDEVKNIFDDLDAKVAADHIQKSGEDLPVKIIIFISRVAISGLAWDLIKKGIKRVYKKFKNPQVVIRDDSSISYSIKKDFTVNVIVTPNRKKEFKNIKDFEDLKKHLKEKHGQQKVINN